MHPTCNSRSWRIQEPPSSLGQKLATSFQNAEHLTFVWIRFFFKHLPFSIENPILQPRFFSWIFHDFSRFFFGFSAPQMGKSHRGEWTRGLSLLGGGPLTLEIRQAQRLVRLVPWPRPSDAMVYPLGNIQKTMENHHFSWENHGKLWKITMLLMGKSTISMAIFNSKLLVYQRVSMVYLCIVWFQDAPKLCRECRGKNGR